MQKKTANCKKLKFALAINYSGKDEILRTCKRLIQNSIICWNYMYFLMKPTCSKYKLYIHANRVHII